MKSLYTILSFVCISTQSLPQHAGDRDEQELNSSQLEEIAESDENDNENDYELQQLDIFREHPLDINGDRLHMLPLLEPLHISNLKSYRALLGDIIDIHELQAVPGFTTELIKLILPFVTVLKEHFSAETISDRLKGGEWTFLVRSSYIPERSQGFARDAIPGNRFAGSRPAVLAKYKYSFRNVLQYGILIDKDAGESFFKTNRIGLPDFYSLHFFSRHQGLIKILAAGDYTINLGQGLIHWQSQAFRKSSAVINVKRQSETLRPYQSAGEYNFHRGFAVSLGKRRWDATIFVSYRLLSANKSSDPSGKSIITSFQYSGLHRTSAELQDKNTVSLITTGTTIKKTINRGHFAVNGVHYRYSIPIIKKQDAYNLYGMNGETWWNCSVDYSFTQRNMHLFGEVALDRNLHKAFVNGAMISLGREVDMAIVHRHISKKYQSLYGNAFTESTMPTNEKGFYTGFAFRPGPRWKIDVYSDLFKYEWLRYRLDAPSAGFSYLMQVTFQPSKKVLVLSRLRYRIKPLNIERNDEDIHWQVPDNMSFRHWRSQVNCQVTQSVLIRSRWEWCRFGHGSATQNGYLFFADVVFKPSTYWLSGSIRFQAFESESYDTRIYVYENDLMYAGGTPAFYNNGVRYYLNLKADFITRGANKKQFTVCLKVASTVYSNLNLIGSGPLTIPGNRASVIKMQLLVRS